MPEYPNDSDGDALRRVAADGSDLSQPMEVDFMVDVHSAESGDRIAAAAQELGYRSKGVENSSEDDDGEDDDLPGRWTVTCTKHMIVTYRSVVDAQAELDRIGEPFGGRCDGWGTFGNAPAKTRT